MALSAAQKKQADAFRQANAAATERVAEASEKGDLDAANQWQVIANQNQAALDKIEAAGS